MDFTTPGYYSWFLPITCISVLFLTKKNRRVQMALILLMSYVFFVLASGWHVILLATSTLLDWKISKMIEKSSDKVTKKRLLGLTLTINLSLLATFKYLDMIIESITWMHEFFWWAPQWDAPGLLLPVGISFYTFQTMSYSIDVYREKYPSYESFIDFAAYAAFFPQLVAGPIVRADHFLEQIKEPLSFEERNLRLAMTFIIYGLVKKVVFANNMAAHVDSIFVEGADLKNTALVWWGTLCFGIQIFCDFSAYTDIAIGSSILLGIRLPENFNTPYAARSPQDFWRRWHISLSTWLRDYLYISLGGSRKGVRRMYFALMTTMLLGGLWHGASWNFVIWGFAHGALLIAHRLLSGTKLVKRSFDWKWSKWPMLVISWTITQFLIFFTWLIFRIEDTSMMIMSLKGFVGYKSRFDLDGMMEDLPEVKFITFGLVIIFVIVHGISAKVGGARERLAKTNPIVWGVFVGMSIIAMVYLRPEHPTEFIYFRF